MPHSPTAPANMNARTLLPRRAATIPASHSEAKSIPSASPSRSRPAQVSAGGAIRSGRSLSKRDLLLVVTQLSIMLRSGVDLADAVHSIKSRSTNPKIREAMGEVYSALECGSRLSDALEAQRHRFGGVMVASVAAGEASGRLPEVLARFSVIVRDELRLQNSLRSALSYPLALILVTGLVLTAMIFFVLPQFAGIYASSRAPTPALTRILLDSAAFARNYWWVVLGGSVLSASFAYRQWRSPWGRRKVDSLLLRLPVFRSICRPLLSGRMFRLQGAMLGSGVPMLEVLQLTRNSIANSCYTELIDGIEESVVNGEGIAETLYESPCIPEGAAEMIATAEANGQLGEVLQTVGEFYESEGEQQLRDAVKIAEPVIIVFLGIVVGAIVLAVMLPLLDLSTAGSV